MLSLADSRPTYGFSSISLISVVLQPETVLFKVLLYGSVNDSPRMIPMFKASPIQAPNSAPCNTPTTFDQTVFPATQQLRLTKDSHITHSKHFTSTMCMAGSIKSFNFLQLFQQIFQRDSTPLPASATKNLKPIPAFGIFVCR